MQCTDFSSKNRPALHDIACAETPYHLSRAISFGKRRLNSSFHLQKITPYPQKHFVNNFKAKIIFLFLNYIINSHCYTKILNSFS